MFKITSSSSAYPDTFANQQRVTDIMFIYYRQTQQLLLNVMVTESRYTT